MRIKTLFFTAIIMSVAAGVFAQDAPKITPYASVRYFIGAYYQNKDFRDYLATAGTETGNDKLDMANSLINTSRLGVKFEKGAISGEAQIRLGPGHQGLVQDALMYGTWKSSFGLEVTFGQTEAPFTYSNANEAWDFSGDGLGSSKYERNPQLKLSFAGLYVDLIRAPKATDNDNTGYQTALYDNRSVHMPLTAVGYEFKSDFADIGIGAAGYKYIVKNAAGAIKDGSSDDDAWTYIGYLHGQIKLGAPYIKFNATYQKSPYMLGMPRATLFKSSGHISSGQGPTADYAGPDGSRMDAFFEGFLEFGLKTDLGTLSANAAYMKNLNAPQGRADRMAVGLNFAIPVVSGFKVTPTALYINELKDRAGDKQGYDLLAGLKLQCDL